MHNNANKEMSMSQGKYSPCARYMNDDCIYNAMGNVPEPYNVGDTYNPMLHFANYDKNGFDNYGYSAFDADGNYLGIARDGVDPLGYTEMDYLVMDETDWDAAYIVAYIWAKSKGLI